VAGGPSVDVGSTTGAGGMLRRERIQPTVPRPGQPPHCPLEVVSPLLMGDTMESLGDGAVEIERRQGVAWITLNRPAAINAINDAIRAHVPVALQTLEDDPAVQVIVVRGAGERGFCAGADLKEKPAADNPLDARVLRARSTWIESFDRVAKPTIAAIHGFCLGGGLEIALACDLRIASADAVFALPETGLGLIPGGGGTQRLPRIIGLGRALDLLLSGERIDANEALRVGLISRLTPDRESLASQAAALAERIALRPPLATCFVKEAARAGVELNLAAGLRLERALFTMLLSSDERREALAAFREKRLPVFSAPAR
jgi:enoyl-CoA hydratase/carnithine racemase